MNEDSNAGQYEAFMLTHALLTGDRGEYASHVRDLLGGSQALQLGAVLHAAGIAAEAIEEAARCRGADTSEVLHDAHRRAQARPLLIDSPFDPVAGSIADDVAALYTLASGGYGPVLDETVDDALKRWSAHDLVAALAVRGATLMAATATAVGADPETFRQQIERAIEAAGRSVAEDESDGGRDAE